MEHVSIFAGAMDKDTSDEFIQPQNYRHLENGDIMYTEGESGAVLLNIKGNDILNISWASDVHPSGYYLNDATDPYSTSNYVIVGGVFIRDDIVLFYANGTYNIVDILKYNGDRTYTRLNVILEKDIGISKTDKVYAISRYEDSSLMKVYFNAISTDGVPQIQLSMINVAPNVIDGVVQDSLLQNNYGRYGVMPSEGIGALGDSAPLTTMGYFKVITGNLKNGVYLYSIRFINKNGNKSAWSPLSEPVILSKSPQNSGTNYLYGSKTVGTLDDLNSNKGIEFSYRVPSAYSYYEVARLYFSSIGNTPQVYLVKRNKIPVNSTYAYMPIIDTNYDTVLETLDVSEFSLPPVFQLPKTLTDKDDILFTANTKEELFDLNFDARSYSYSDDGTPIAQLYDEGNSLEYEIAANGAVTDSTGGSVTDWSDIPIEADAFNMRNDIDNDYNSSYNKFRFQNDGSTFGATGINVDLSFLETYLPVSNIGEDFDWNDDVDEWALGSKRVFQKDEIYRFGLVFFNSDGRRTPVKWIGDFRMPDYYDIHSGSGDTVNVNLLQIRTWVPKFTVRTAGTEAEGLSYQIVYVKRDYSDRTVITEGVGTSLFEAQSKIDWLDNFALPYWKVHISTANDSMIYSAGIHDLNGANTNPPDYLGLETPEVMYNGNLDLTGKRLDQIGFMGYITMAYDKTLHSAGRIPANDPSRLRPALNYFKPKTLTVFDDRQNRSSDIDDDTFITSGGSGYVGSKLINGSTGLYLGNSTIDDDSNYFIGDSCSRQWLYCPAYTDVIASQTMHNYDIPYFRVRQSTTQYGGRGYKARLSNAYIPASEITTVDGSYIGTSYCIYGDTFYTMFEYYRTTWPVSDRDDDSDPSTGPAWYKMSEVIVLPVESSINTYMAHGDTFTRLTRGDENAIPYTCQQKEDGLGYAKSLTLFNQDTSNYITFDGGSVTFNPLYQYNSVYSRVNDIQYSLPIENDYLKEETKDVRIRYSDTKVNGETRDSWLEFKTLNFKDADAGYGSINYMDTFHDNVFIWQDTGFANVLVHPRVQVQSQDGVEMEMGTGGTLHDIRYLSTDVGIQGINEASSSFSSMYWLDNNKKKIYRFSGQLESISDTKNMSSYLNSTVKEDSVFLAGYDAFRDKMFMTIRNEYGGSLDLDTMTVSASTSPGLTLSGDTSRIEMMEGLSYNLVDTNGNSGEYNLVAITSTTLDFIRTSGAQIALAAEVDMTLYVKTKDSYTLAFDEPTNSFRSFESFIPSLYIRGAQNFYTSEDSAILYEHNVGNYGEFYGTVYPMIVDVVINKGQNLNKSYGAVNFINSVFNSVRGTEDELDYDGTENKTLSSIRMIADRQQTPYMDLYVKDDTIVTEVVDNLSTGDIDDSNYNVGSGVGRTIRDTSGQRIIPYPEHLYNIRHTLNEFRANLPRVDTGRVDAINGNKPITELIRGNQATLRAVYENTDNDLLKLKSIVTHFNTSIDA